MGNPAIDVSNAHSVNQLPPPRIRNSQDWNQRYSDLFAHYLQVHRQICNSRWLKISPMYGISGPQEYDSRLPDFEAFVFAAVYYRQLIGEGDKLFSDTIDCYNRFADCPIRHEAMQSYKRSFFGILNSKPIPLPVDEYTSREIFDAFLYGASLIHRKPTPQKRSVFRALNESFRREHLLFALNGALRLLLNPISNVAVIIHRDVFEWIDQYSLPQPDIPLHNRVF